MHRTLWILGAVAAVALLAVLPPSELAAADIPSEFQNLQIFDKDISQEELKAIMDGFTEMLGVKCTHCHILDEYHKDDLEHKVEARKMIQLVGFLRQNAKTYFKADLEPDTVSCWTCHRGEPEVKAFEPEDDEDWM